ncbi:hypothetical protein DOTSEDRAFT_71032 [Dothistroma septosporum NZE10]|uniref:Uncharacterized protein n=1 Tax=Dothistroma septosporum (strain NZE10 / CBS 128990) TaxID=675120 RepID=N1PQF0_DOTSN|nr:hypothetical protein DOTSEDRAFT_71032 [Dothistroma septosporum NZE10]
MFHQTSYDQNDRKVIPAIQTFLSADNRVPELTYLIKSPCSGIRSLWSCPFPATRSRICNVASRKSRSSTDRAQAALQSIDKARSVLISTLEDIHTTKLEVGMLPNLASGGDSSVLCSGGLHFGMWHKLAFFPSAKRCKRSPNSSIKQILRGSKIRGFRRIVVCFSDRPPGMVSERKMLWGESVASALA